MCTIYEKIRKAIIEENSDYTTKAIERVKTNDGALQNESTSLRWNQYKNGIISHEKAVNYAVERITKARKKALDNKIAKLDRIASAENVTEIVISVEWKRNTTWGHNPTATVTVYTENHVYTATGKASGCGYDKRSAAIASAMNEIDSALKLIYDLRENGKLPYGAGYDSIATPYYEGGVGISCYHTIFAECGFEKIADHGTKTTDYYHYVKK